MPPTLALFLTFGFTGFLFWRESRQKIRTSRALWIPLAWLLATASRFPSQWLTLNRGIGPITDEGSPIDAIFFFSLIVIGLCVLSRRRVSLGEFARNNVWLTVFLLYCLA